MKRKFVIGIGVLAASAVIFLSCSNKSNDKLVWVNEKTDLKELPLDSMFTVLRYIQLETTSDALIGNHIGKIRKFNGKYYISSDRKELLIFGNDGSFVRKISSLGNGPGEYRMLSDFDVLPNNDIAILDARKVIIYDEEGGYKRDIPLSINCFNIKDLNGKEFLIYSSGEEYVIYQCDYNGKIIEKYFKHKKITRIYSDVPLFSVNNTVLFQIGVSVNFVSIDPKERSFAEIYLLNNNECLTSEKEENLQEEYAYDYLYRFPDLKIIFGTSTYTNYLAFKVGNNDGHRVYVVDIKNKNELKYKSEYISDRQNENNLKMDYIHLGIADDCFIDHISHQDFALMQGVYDENVLYEDNPILIELIVREFPTDSIF